MSLSPELVQLICDRAGLLILIAVMYEMRIDGMLPSILRCRQASAGFCDSLRGDDPDGPAKLSSQAPFLRRQLNHRALSDPGTVYAQHRFKAGRSHHSSTLVQRLPAPSASGGLPPEQTHAHAKAHASLARDQIRFLLYQYWSTCMPRTYSRHRQGGRNEASAFVVESVRLTVVSVVGSVLSMNLLRTH